MTVERVLNQRGDRILGVKITGVLADCRLCAHGCHICDIAPGDTYVNFARLFTELWQKYKREYDHVRDPSAQYDPVRQGELFLLIVQGTYNFPDLLKLPSPTSVPADRVEGFYLR